MIIHLKSFLELMIVALLAVWVGLIRWTYTDAHRRISNRRLAKVATLAGVFAAPGLPIYIMLRPPDYVEDVRRQTLEMKALEKRLAGQHRHDCPHCGYVLKQPFTRCPQCAGLLRQSCVRCRRSLDVLWKICPFCGAAAQPRPRPRPGAPSPDRYPSASTELADLPDRPIRITRMAASGRHGPEDGGWATAAGE